MDPQQVKRGPDGVPRCSQCGFTYNLEPAHLLTAVRAGLEKVRAALAGVPAEERSARPSPQVWSANAYLGHLHRVAELINQRVAAIAGEERPELPAMDQDQTVVVGQLDEVPGEVSLARLETAAQAFEEHINSLPEGAWDRVGRLEGAGEVSLRDVAHDLPHELHHHGEDLKRLGGQHSS